jgi:hypothetical protein
MTRASVLFSSLYALFETWADDIAPRSWDTGLNEVRIGPYDRVSRVRLAP